MRAKWRFVFFAVFALLVFGAGFFLGRDTASEAARFIYSAEAPAGVDFEPVWKAWWLLQDKFVAATSSHELSPEDRVWGMIGGLADSYDDPYTVFLPPQESKSFDEELSGEFGGIGVEIGMRDSILTVIAPLKGTPAAEAGLRAGDLILEVDGASTKNMTIDDAVARIRGEIGTPIVLTVAREGEQELLELRIMRDNIRVPTLDSELRDDGVFVISLYNFGGTAAEEMRRALRTFVESGSSKLVLDLRGNPGGFVESAVDAASWFLPVGKVILTEDFGSEEAPIIHRSKGYDIMDESVRMVVLIDGGSASASEIVAGALREHGEAVLIGVQTFGKGSVQELVDLTPETSLKITVAQWLTPDGITISEGGLTPDLVVPFTRTDVEDEQDPQLDAAINYLQTGALVVPEPVGLEAEKEVE